MRRQTRASLFFMAFFLPSIFVLHINSSVYSFVIGCSPCSSSSSQPISLNRPRSFRSGSGLSKSSLGSTKETDIRIDNINGLARVPLPDRKKNVFGRLTFQWVGDLIYYDKKQNHTRLELSDLWQLDSTLKIGNSSERFDNFFKSEILADAKINRKINKSNILLEFWSYPLTRALVKMYKKEFLFSGALKFINTVIQFFPSLIIARILQLVSDSGKSNPLVSVANEFRQKGLFLCFLLLLFLTSKTIVENAYFDVAINLGATVRGVLSAAIYRKSLLLNPQGRQNFTTGEVSNYIQLDSNRMELVAANIHTVWDGLFQILGYTTLLIKFLGPSAFAGIAVLFVMIPLNAYFLNRLSKLRVLNLKYSDNRVKLTNEILQGIRAIKSYNWEIPFLKQISKIRGAELDSMQSAAILRGALVAILSAAPSFVAVFTLSVYALLGNELSPAKIFTALTLFNQLRFPVIFFPLLLNTLADGKVSLKRLSNFFLSSELENYIQHDQTKNHLNSIEICGADFAWANIKAKNSSQSISSSQSSRGKLKNVNLEIKKGELIAVVGPVGSGKSMIMSALLGELALLNGTVAMNGRVAYVPQSSWIPNDSLRNVILFGRQFNQAKYINALRSCGLLKDLSHLENGDETEIGERGVNLSGGQKQRVSLARAVYDDADIYLLDDPLSALDADVGHNVFNRAINGALSSKTRILVTHQLRVLPQVDRIILMNTTADGQSCEIIDQGTLKELFSRGHDLTKIVSVAKDSKSIAEEPFPIVPASIIPDPDIQLSLSSATDVDTALLSNPTENLDSVEIEPTIEHNSEAINQNTYNPTDKTDACNSNESETKIADIRRKMPGSSISLGQSPVEILKSRGKIEPSKFPSRKVSSTVNKCLSNSDKSESNTSQREPKKLINPEERIEGAVEWPVYKAYIAASKSPALIIALLLSFALANVAQIGQLFVVSAWTSDVGFKKLPLIAYLLGMAGSAVAVALFNWARTYLAHIIGNKASETLHYGMAKRVLQAPLSFFESTPVGRLMQRFSKDLDSMDQQLPGTFNQLVASALNIAGALIAVCVVTPSFALVILPVLFLYNSLTNRYRNVARELKRLDSLSRSPIYAHFSETLGGLSVIRSFQRQKLFQRSNEVKLDDNLSAHFALKAADRWLSIRLECLGNVLVFFSGILAVMSRSKAGITGISLNNALSITSLLNWAVRNGVETESLMNSVERVVYTSTQTPQEQMNSSNSSSIEGTEAWPWKGGISLKDVEMKYRPDFDPVLKGVSLDIYPGERIGVVGRTGSGKSSLFRALLRLTELSNGSITIDGVDISSVTLDSLRSAVSVIPQDPVLFSGTIRFNLDPFNMRTDEELWKAIRKANLLSLVYSLPGGLNFKVSEGGDNFSAGQRQLICLARAMVRKSKLLLLDEATSSVDFETDALIQRAIRKEFIKQSSTVLTIAHRLDTILDADRILVMEDGRVAEFDKPHVLLMNRSSAFAKLVASENRRKLDKDSTESQTVEDLS